MNYERAVMLAAALESGEYKKGKGQLRDEKNCFCVLGVACNIYAQHHPEIAAAEKNPMSFLGEEFGLPKKVQEWFGFKTDSGHMESDGRFLGSSLIFMNDTSGYSFKKIAAHIRKNWELL